MTGPLPVPVDDASRSQEAIDTVVQTFDHPTTLSVDYSFEGDEKRTLFEVAGRECRDVRTGVRWPPGRDGTRTRPSGSIPPAHRSHAKNRRTDERKPSSDVRRITARTSSIFGSVGDNVPSRNCVERFSINESAPPPPLRGSRTRRRDNRAGVRANLARRLSDGVRTSPPSLGRRRGRRTPSREFRIGTRVGPLPPGPPPVARTTPAGDRRSMPSQSSTSPLVTERVWRPVAGRYSNPRRSDEVCVTQRTPSTRCDRGHRLLVVSCVVDTEYTEAGPRPKPGDPIEGCGDVRCRLGCEHRRERPDEEVASAVSRGAVRG